MHPTLPSTPSPHSLPSSHSTDHHSPSCIATPTFMHPLCHSSCLWRTSIKSKCHSLITYPSRHVILINRATSVSPFHSSNHLQSLSPSSLTPSYILTQRLPFPC